MSANITHTFTCASANSAVSNSTTTIACILPPSQGIPEFSFGIIGAIILAVVIVTLYLVVRRRKKD